MNSTLKLTFYVPDFKYMQNPVVDKLLMVHNPLTGKMINILPILEFLEGSCYSNLEGGSEGYATIDLTIKLLVTSLTEDSDLNRIQGNIQVLYQLRDAFGKMK